MNHILELDKHCNCSKTAIIYNDKRFGTQMYKTTRKIRSLNGERLTQSLAPSDVSLEGNKKPARYHFAGSVWLGKQKGTLKGNRNVRRACDSCSILDAGVQSDAFLRLLRLFRARLLHALLIENRSSPLPSLPPRERAFVTRSSYAGSRNPRDRLDDDE